MTVSARFDFYRVWVDCTGYVDKADNYVHIESAEINGEDITPWIDEWPALADACEEALNENAL